MPPTTEAFAELTAIFPPQAFLISLLVFFMFAIALTGICSVMLWCYMFVWLDRHFRKAKPKEYFL
ncbi:hypothetical protein ANCCAN_05467 [Ancylostoma caninum]|uniref:Uncharacterized protein n=1 Tax=Ancylostoma caninum TaxID=29170 RepID=A0A368GVT2_ANCCA|nr:hypothetical protein ANCCAN_05467 [Ancylostoma caninum]